MTHYHIAYANLLQYVENDYLSGLQNIKTKDGQSFDYFSPEQIDGMLEKEFHKYNSEVIAVLAVSAQLLSQACEDLRALKPAIVKIADQYGGVNNMLTDLEIFYAGCESFSLQMQEAVALQLIINAKMRNGRGYYLESNFTRR